MATLSSEEALNGILNILETNINIYNSEKLKSSANKADDFINDLLSGAIRDDSKIENVAEQIEILSSSIEKIKDIDTAKLDLVAVSVNSFLGSLTEGLSKGARKSIKPIADLMASLVSIVNVNISQIEETLKPDHGLKIGIQIGLFISEIIKSIDGAKIDKSMQYLGHVLTPVVLLLNNNFNKIKIGYNPLRGYLLGLLISMFIKQILRAIRGEKIDKSMQYLGDILTPIVNLLTNNFNKIKIGFNPLRGYLLGRLMGMFVNQILKATKDMEINESMKHIGLILNPLVAFIDPKNKISLFKIIKVFNVATGTIIAGFFKAIIKDMPDNKTIGETLKGVNAILETIFRTKKKDLKNIKVFAKALDPEYGKSINDFIKNLVRGKWDNKKLESVTKFMSSVLNVIKSLVGCLVIMAVTFVFAPISVIASMFMLKHMIKFIKDTIIDLAEISNKDSKHATNILNSASSMIRNITLSLVLMTAATALFGIPSVIASIIVLKLTVSSIKGLITELTGKDITDGTSKALKATYGIASLIIALSASLAILSYVVDRYETGTIIASIVILALLVGASIKIIKTLSADAKNVDKASDALLKIAAAFTIISVISSVFLIPLGKQMGPALKGAFVVGLILAVCIFFVKLLSSDKMLKDTTEATFTMLALTGIYALLGLVTAKIIIPLGEKWDKALAGAGVVLGLITVLIIGVLVLGRVSGKTYGEAILATAALAVILLGVSLITKEILIPIGEKWPEALIGASVVLGLITVFGLIVWGLSKLVEKHGLEILAAEGLLIGLGIAMTAMMLPVYAFMKIAEIAKSIDDAVIKNTAAVAGGILAAGVVLVGIVAVASAVGGVTTGFIAAAEGLIIGLGIAMTALLAPVYVFIHLAKLIKTITQKDIDNATTKIVNIFSGILGISTSLLALGAELALSTVLLPIITVGVLGITGVVLLMSSLYKKINEDITPELLTKATNLIVNKDGKDSLIGGIGNIVDAIYDMPWTKIKNVAIKMLPLRFMIGTISLYVDVIMKVATGSYVTGYDENGKPIYEHVDPSYFDKAGYAVTRQFLTFVKNLNKGFDDLGTVSSYFYGIIAKHIRPIIDTVSLYVDVIMKVATGNYVTGYDDNGKPVYEHLDPNIFKDAATHVNDGFKSFLTALNDGFSGLSLNAMATMLVIGDTIKPIVDTVSSFVDAILRVATGLYITEYDSNGKPVYEQLSAEDWDQAAVKVNGLFGAFLTTLNDGFSKMKSSTVRAILSLSSSIVPIMDGVSKFVDAILKLATGLYIDRFDKDENGNMIPHFLKVTDDMYTKAAGTIATNFSTFIDKLVTAFDNHGDFWGNRTEDALNAIGGSIGPVMEGVGTYVDAVMKVATGTYVERMVKDKDGKYIPIYKHLNAKLFEKAAQNISKYFISFVEALITKLHEPGFLLKTEEASTAIQGTIAPIMKSLKDFSDSLKPFLEMKTGTGKNVLYLCMQPGKIQLIATDIAGSFTTFLTIISDNFKENKEKYESISKTAKSVLNTLKLVKNAVLSLASVIKSMTDKDGNVISNGTSVVTNFTGVLDSIVNYFTSSSNNYNVAHANAESAKKTLAVLVAVSKFYSRIILLLKGTEDGKTSTNNLIDKFIKNMGKLADITSSKLLTVSSEAIKVYSNSLNTFGVKLSVTTKKVYTFTTRLIAAKQALAKLDAEIINKERARNKALDEFAERIDNIANAVNRMTEAFNNLDENRILRNFDNIRELIESVNTTPNNLATLSTTNAPWTSTTQNTRPVNNTQTTQPTKNTKTQQVIPTSGRVTFEFKDCSLQGFFHTTP